MTERECKNCTWFVAHTDPDAGGVVVGDCHWFPAVYPVFGDHWCAQYRQANPPVTIQETDLSWMKPSDQACYPIQPKPWTDPARCGIPYRAPSKASTSGWVLRLCALEDRHTGEHG